MAKPASKVPLTHEMVRENMRLQNEETVSSEPVNTSRSHLIAVPLRWALIERFREATRLVRSPPPPSRLNTSQRKVCGMTAYMLLPATSCSMKTQQCTALRFSVNPAKDRFGTLATAPAPTPAMSTFTSSASYSLCRRQVDEVPPSERTEE